MADLYIGPQRSGRTSFERIIVEDRSLIQLEAGATVVSDGDSPIASVPILRQVTKTLTDAQIKALPTAGVVVLDPPDTGLFYLPQFVTVKLVPSGGTYTNIDASAFILLTFGEYDSDASTYIRLPITTSTTLYAVATPATILADVDGVANVFGQYTFAVQAALGLQIWAYNGEAGNFTGGHAANSMRVSVTYLTYDDAQGLFI